MDSVILVDYPLGGYLLKSFGQIITFYKDYIIDCENCTIEITSIYTALPQMTTPNPKTTTPIATILIIISLSIFGISFLKLFIRKWKLRIEANKEYVYLDEFEAKPPINNGDEELLLDNEEPGST